MSRVTIVGAVLAVLAAATTAQAQQVRDHGKVFDPPIFEGGGAPGPVTLAVSWTGVNEVGLSCVTPADPDNDIASVDFRYSTSPITLGNFYSASQVVDGLLPPGDVDTLLEVTATGLQENTIYYFAVRYTDSTNLYSQSSTAMTTHAAAVVSPTPSPTVNTGGDGGGGGGNGGGSCSASGILPSGLGLILLLAMTLHLRK